MIIQEQFEDNGKIFIRTYSNEKCYVVRDGVEYSEAIDPAEYNRQYVEGRYIENEEEIF